MKTTLNEIRAKSPCSDGWSNLLAHLGKTKADDEPLSIVTILDSNGLDDARDAAGDAAWDAARDAQAKRLREVCAECDTKLPA